MLVIPTPSVPHPLLVATALGKLVVLVVVQTSQSDPWERVIEKEEGQRKRIHSPLTQGPIRGLTSPFFVLRVPGPDLFTLVEPGRLSRGRKERDQFPI